MGELWKRIDGCNNLYEISNTGKVKRINKTRPNRILKGVPDKDGYFHVSISDGHGNIRRASIHRLVAAAFCDKPEGHNVVNHIDENKQNNNAENLEWCTPKQNTNHRNMPKRRSASQRKPIVQMDLSGNIIKKWISRSEIVAETGFSGGNISSCCLGKRKTAYGFRWVFADDIERLKSLWGGE